MRLACVASVSVVQCRKSELESKIRNPGNFCLWNAERGKILLMESGIQLEILLTFGIQNPSSTDKIGLTESGRFVPMDVSYPDDSYPKLR